MTVDPDAILPTSGGQQALDLVCKILIDPGDVIIAEAPTYPGAVPTFCSYEADVIQVPMDRDGMQIDKLEGGAGRLEQAGRRPKFIYTIPNFHNPAGVTMSLERRRELLRIAGERELLVLEDNPYGLLRYEGEPIPTLYSLDSDFVLYTGTFSKILSPGVRIGWAVAPPPVLAKLDLGKRSSDLCSSSISQYFIAEYFASGPWIDYVRSLIEIYRRRRDVMLDALAEHFPREATWTHPQGGLFIWATLPDYIDTTDLLARAMREQVAFVPGRAAYLDGRGGSSMRLNFCGVGEDEIREGIRRLGEVVREQVALYSTLTGETGSGRVGSGSDAGSGPMGERGGQVAATGGPPESSPDSDGAGVGTGDDSRRADKRARLSPTRISRKCCRCCASAPDEPRRRSEGRALAGAPGIAELGRAGRGRAPAARPRGRPDRRRRRPGHAADRRRRLMWRSSSCTAATARTAPFRSCSKCSGSPTRARVWRPASDASDKVLAKLAMRRAGIPTPEFFAFNETAFRDLDAGQALPAAVAPAVPDRRQARQPRLGARDQVRALSGRGPDGPRRRLLL